MSRLSALTQAVTVAITDLFHLVTDPSGTNTDKKITASDLRHFITKTYNVMDYGAVGDGATDDYTAVMAAHTAASLTGGDVYFPPGNTYRINSQFILPNNGQSIPSQRPIKWVGGGALFNGRGGAPYGGSIIDLRYSGSGAKIESYGLGVFEICNLTLTDYGTSSNAFVKVTSTTFMPHDMAVIGNSTKQNATCDQDAFILGGLTTTIDGTTDAPFQGYGTVIERCYFGRIQRGIVFQTYANAIIVQNNTWWATCGGSCAIEFAPLAGQYCVGNVVTGNLIEMVNYTYGIKADYITATSFIGNNFYDPTSITAFYRFAAHAQFNFVLAGYSDDTKTLFSDASGGSNTIINPHQSQSSVFPQVMDFTNAAGVNFSTPINARNAAVGYDWQPATASAETSIPLKARRSAAESSNPGAVIFQIQQKGQIDIGGTNAGNINFYNQDGSTQFGGFSGNGKNWFASGAGGAMSQNSGTGGSYLTLRNFGVKILDHTGVEQLRLGAGIDGILFGSLLDTNLKRSSADVLKTDDRFWAAAGLVTNTGNTASRPASPQAGQMYFDTTLTKPVWYSGSNWVDATGATV